MYGINTSTLLNKEVRVNADYRIEHTQVGLVEKVLPNAVYLTFRAGYFSGAWFNVVEIEDAYGTSNDDN